MAVLETELSSKKQQISLQPFSRTEIDQVLVIRNMYWFLVYMLVNLLHTQKRETYRMVIVVVLASGR